MSAIDGAELTRYLHENIPLTAAMQLAVLDADTDRVRLRAPLSPNRNHQGGAFGGSIATLALTACWTLAHLHVRGRSPEPAIFVGEQQVGYLHRADDAIEATCAGPDAAAWTRFDRALERRGRGRIELAATVASGGVDVARFTGRFAALLE